MSEEDKESFYAALYAGKLTTVSEMLKNNPDLAKVKDENGKTVLHNAVYYRNPDIVKVLLEANPDLAKAKDKNGETALHHAAKFWDPRVAQALLEANPELASVQDKNGDTVLHRAVQSGSPDLVKALLEKNPELASLKNKNGETALHHAAKSYKHPDLVKALLEANPRLVFEPDKDGKSPLAYSEERAGAQKTDERAHNDRQGNAYIIKAASDVNPEFKKFIESSPLHRGILDSVDELEYRINPKSSPAPSAPATLAPATPTQSVSTAPAPKPTTPSKGYLFLQEAITAARKSGDMSIVEKSLEYNPSNAIERGEDGKTILERIEAEVKSQKPKNRTIQDMRILEYLKEAEKIANSTALTLEPNPADLPQTNGKVLLGTITTTDSKIVAAVQSAIQDLNQNITLTGSSPAGTQLANSYEPNAVGANPAGTKLRQL